MKIVVSVLATILIVALLFFTATPAGRTTWNNWWNDVQEADDESNYDTLKKVEDTCRSMIASYESDKLMYEQYKDSDNEEQQGWAAQAKNRANSTAVKYNNYILENEHVWKDAVPSDIYKTLEIIE